MIDKAGAPSVSKKSPEVYRGGFEKKGYLYLNNLIDAGDSVDLVRLDTAQETGEINQEDHAKLSRKLLERHEIVQEGLVNTGKKIEPLRKENITDPLTGMLNRRALDKELANAVKRLNPETEKQGEKRESDPGYVLFFVLDVDDFKLVNDTYGHLKGDEALKAVAECLEEESVERKGTAGRFGGDEFAMIQERKGILTENELLEISKRVQRKINSHLAVLLSSQKLNITVSVGCAILKKGETKTVDQLKTEADHQMYIAKNGNGIEKAQ